MKKISQPKLMAMPIPVLPVEIQNRIITQLDGLQAEMDELRRLQAQTQKELDASMPSGPAKAFAGELSACHDLLVAWGPSRRPTYGRYNIFVANIVHSP